MAETKHQNSGEDPATTEEKEEWYSVWALPPPDVRDRLKQLMSSLREEFGGPVFDPHITVVGAIRLKPSEAAQKLRSAAAELRPYSASVAAVSRGTFFYQCVYLLIQPTPEVMEASANCRSHFGYYSSIPYMPHLSLLYADLDDEEKEKARKRGEELAEGVLGAAFKVDSIALYKTDTEDKSLESWELVEKCDLQSDM